jgi:hypothetical protein
LASGPALRGLSEALAVPVVAPEAPTAVETPTEAFTGALPPRARRVEAAEDSMTLGEERFYRCVWGAPADSGVIDEGGQSRVLSLGYDRLARLVRLDEKSVRALIPKLAGKRILEVVAAEDSPTRTGRTYRIFSPARVLERQRAAGQEYVVKRGRAVEFVRSTVGVSTPDPLSPAEAVLAALREHAPATPSDAAAILEAVRAVAPSATTAQVVRAIHQRSRAGRAAGLANPMAYLLAYVPRCFR